MINRFALSFLCIELDRNEIYGVTGLYILLPYLRCREASKRDMKMTGMDTINWEVDLDGRGH